MHGHRYIIIYREREINAGAEEVLQHFLHCFAIQARAMRQTESQLSPTITEVLCTTIPDVLCTRNSVCTLSNVQADSF